jgi:RNA polymerase sigma-70 factor, ECF subfamily
MVNRLTDAAELDGAYAGEPPASASQVDALVRRHAVGGVAVAAAMSSGGLGSVIGERSALTANLVTLRGRAVEPTDASEGIAAERRGLSRSEADTIDALRRGDERVFTELVDRHGSAMLRVARVYAPDRAVCEEIVQEAWIGVLRGIDRFEGRSSLRTWLVRIVANVAKTRAVREARSVPFSALADADLDEEEPSVAPERFRGPGDRWAGHWASPPREWTGPEQQLLSAETRAQIAAAIDVLPEGQRAVITLRDIEGLSAREVCTALQISEGNQRVLLHRARTRLRHTLDRFLTAVEAPQR